MSDFIPYKATHPGEMILDDMKELGITQAVMSKRTGIPKSVLCDIIKGRRNINAESAILIADVLGYDPEILMRAQNNYDLDKARISERIRRQQRANATWDVLKNFISVEFFRKAKILKGNVADDVDAIFNIFGVDSVDGIIDLNAKEAACACYRKSEVLTTDPKELFSWKYYCFYLAKSISVESQFDKERCGGMTDRLNAIIRSNSDTVNAVRHALADYGVKFMIVPKYGKMPVDGFVFWNDDNPTLVMTLRKKSIDNFAFTLLHEIGHIMLHLEKGGFADIDIENSVSERESEANAFAQDSMLPSSVWNDFLRKKMSPYKIMRPIKEIADSYGINPQVLVGRYMFSTGFYSIRSPFKKDIDGI